MAAGGDALITHSREVPWPSRAVLFFNDSFSTVGMTVERKHYRYRLTAGIIYLYNYPKIIKKSS